MFLINIFSVLVIGVCIFEDWYSWRGVKTIYDIPSKETMVAYLEEKGEAYAMKELSGYMQDQLHEIWGKPDEQFSGRYGDVWKVGETTGIIIIYDDYGGGIVEQVKLNKRIPGKDNGDTQTITELDYEVQYIRTNGYHEKIMYPFSCIIESKEQLEEYYENVKSMYDLERRENPLSDMTIGFLDACDAYNEEYFQNNSLILVLLEEGSGSIRHNVKSLQKVDYRLKISIDRIIPEAGTDDMAEWHIIIAVDKKYIPENEENIEIFLE